MHTRFYWRQLSDFPEEQRQYIYPPVLHEEPVFWHLNHLSNFCILTDIKYLIVILISISLFSCEWESIFICMFAFQEFLPCIISSCLRESVFSLLFTNQTILFPLFWRVTFTMCQSHIQSGIYSWGLYSVPHLFCLSLCIPVHIVCITMAFSYISVSCVVTLSLLPYFLFYFKTDLDLHGLCSSFLSPMTIY